MLIPRRTFLTSALAAGTLGAMTKAAGAEIGGKPGREYYDLRAYRLPADGSAVLLERYLEGTLVPGLRARGIGPVGIFEQTAAEPARADERVLWVLIPCPDIATFADVAAEFNRDAAVQASAGEYFTGTRKQTRAFSTIDAWLLLAFAGQARLRLPVAQRQASRVFELRMYASANEERALAKIAMFNDGEIDVMHEVGLSPVFYGQALSGTGLPQLTYMTSGPDMETHLQHWKAFGVHPKWVEMRSDPRYADTVSRMLKYFLKPTAYSEI